MKDKTDKFSSTAFLVALGTLYAARDPHTRHLVPEQSAQLGQALLLTLRPGLHRLIDLMDNKFFRILVQFILRRTVPGMFAHYALRKRHLEDILQNALKEGFSQIVVLGAGFDSLLYRLHHRHPGVLFIEADHPATGAAKQKALTALKTPEANLRFLSLNLSTEEIHRKLKSIPDYSPTQPTFFLAEGLLMYLQPHRVKQLFGNIREHNAAGSRIAFTFMEHIKNGRIGFQGQSRLTDLWLRLKGEPFTWGAKESEVGNILSWLGYERPLFSHGGDLQEVYFPNCPKQALPAVGESICVSGTGKLTRRNQMKL